MDERLTQFWPFWTGRVVWLLLLLALTGWLAGGTLSEPLWLAVAGALLLQLLWAVAARRGRLPRGHNALSLTIAALLVALGLTLFPDGFVVWFWVALVPLLDLAYWRGWGASVALLALFPALPLALLVAFGGSLPMDWQTLSLWLVVALLASRIAAAAATARRATAAEVSANAPPTASAERSGQVLAQAADRLARETQRPRILETLVRGGAEALDNGHRRHRARALALTFKPGLGDVLEVAATHNLEGNFASRNFELNGVLATLLQDGEPIETSADQPPFHELRALRGHHLMLFPLRTGLDVYGAALFASKDRERVAQEEVQRTLIALADQASLALHNTVLQQEVRRTRDQRLGGEEEARHQLARDLHDGPVQRVAAISMQLEFIKALLQRQPERALGEIEQLQQVARQAAEEMRTILFTLRPVVLASEGLVAALTTFVKRLREQERLPITLEADPLPRLEPKVEELTFAILQEAIGNARKYAGGAPIRVRLIKGETMVVGQVEDEGPGFDLQAVTASYGTRASLGLLNMQERAALVGGQLRIDTAPNRGTVVSIAVPFRRE